MKLLYIVGNYGILSETFIADLIDGFVKEGVNLEVIANEAIEDAPDFVRKHNFIKQAHFIERLSCRLPWVNPQEIPEIQWRNQVNRANLELENILKKSNHELAYIDFGNICALVQQALVNKGIPFVVHFHGADISAGLNRAGYVNDLKFCFNHAAGLLCASQHIRRLLVLAGAPREKIKVIPYGFNLEGVKQLSWTSRNENTPSVVFLGRFTTKKHPIALVESFAIAKAFVTNAKLTMIGDGPEREGVEERIQQLGLTNSVQLTGALQRREALKIVNNHWIYAQHSVTARTGDQEGFGISLVEAAVLGLPVVSTWHNGIPESVIDGETGFLVREYDYERMGEKLGVLLGDPALCQTMGNNGQKRMQQNFSQVRRVQTMVEYLRDLAGHKRNKK